MRISSVIFRVADLDRAVAFWRDRVGLALQWTGGSFAFFTAGEVQLVLNQPEVFRPVDGDTEVVFEVDDVAHTHAAMSERGVEFAVEPRPVTSDGKRDPLRRPLPGSRRQPGQHHRLGRHLRPEEGPFGPSCGVLPNYWAV